MICKDTLNYGLKLTKIGHLIQFAMIDFIANQNDLTTFENNKELLVGRYFGLYVK